MEITNLLLSRLSVAPWAIHPGMFDVITGVINNKLAGLSIKPQLIEAEDDDTVKYAVYGDTAVIPLHGIVLKKTMGMQGMSGIVTTLKVKESLQLALDNDKVSNIVLDMDSPGGTVDGTMEVANMVYEARKEKHIIAYTGSMAASAMYWIGSAAHEVIVSESADVGSIGVYMMHIDQSGYDEKQGVKVSYIQAGKYKTVGNPHSPLDDFSSKELQSHVDYIYTLFTKDVARNRGVSHAKVLEGMAEGRIFIGQQAVDAGLADSIGTLDNLIEGSNNYSFLKNKGDSMLGTKLKDATVEQLKGERADLVDAVTSEAIAGKDAEIAVLQQSIANGKAKEERKEKILSHATKLGQADFGAELAESDCSVEDALCQLISKSGEQGQEALEAFESTASQTAGDSGEAEEETPLPKDQASSINFCQAKYEISRKEAIRKAKLDFPSFFGAAHQDKSQNQNGGN